jgi:dTDP-4-dehydrorhamnose 3,5-epimerase-like enzyme
MARKKAPELIEGELAVDDRGQLSFVDGFSMEGVKRFYQIQNFSLDTIRAFHGHMKEAKYFYVAKGSVIAAAVELDDTKKPSKKNKVDRYILSSRKPSILFIPAGFANGIKALEEDTVLIVFSTSTLEESKGDDYRFPADYWGESIWQVANR